jgi:hypothetical protein
VSLQDWKCYLSWIVHFARLQRRKIQQELSRIHNWLNPTVPWLAGSSGQPNLRFNIANAVTLRKPCPLKPASDTTQCLLFSYLQRAKVSMHNHRAWAHAGTGLLITGTFARAKRHGGIPERGPSESVVAVLEMVLLPCAHPEVVHGRLLDGRLG